MKIKNLKLKIEDIINPMLIIFLAVILRLIPHPPNVAPIAALALFGGAYLDIKYAFMVPLVAMIASDFFLGFHATIPFVYGSFLLTGLIGLWIRRMKNVQTIILATFSSSILFYLVTNFGVWITSNMYSKDLSGLLQAYTYALPFFRNTILGDFLYTGLFFGGYETLLLLKRQFALSKS